MTDTPPGRNKLLHDPIGWLFKASLTVLGAAIALQWAVCILARIWPWLAGIVLLAGVVAITFRVLAAKRRQW